MHSILTFKSFVHSY